MSHLPMKLLRRKIEKRNLKLRQRNLKLQQRNLKLQETENGDVSEETMGGRKVKKSKHSMNVGLSEAQNGDVSQEAVENTKVKKSPQKSIELTNGEAAMQSPNSESKKKKKKKKRKMVNDAGPDRKKAKTENKGESEEESAESPKETENNVEKPDNDEDDSEVPSLPLGLTGKCPGSFLDIASLKYASQRVIARRQTMLFSATQTRKVEDLARISLKKEPLYVGVDDDKANATVDGLEQGYVVCPSEKRFLLLFTFLKKNRKKKLMVFFSSCMSVKYHYELLNYIDLPVLQKQNKRTTTFFQFCNADSGTLLCTDVAARGLDIPEVDWIVQYDPPDDPKEYIHRVGRTARGLNGRGHALLILRPEELGFLRYLKQSKVPLSEFDFSWSKISDIQSQLEKLIEKNYFLHKSSQEAYKSYIRAYDSHSLKQIFNVNNLNLPQVALSFGFKVPPFVDLNILFLMNNEGKQKKRGGGGGFGYQKPRNKKSSDSRQFSH
uniref:ATP-dependent RNA helicase n=1 Tax=Saimiri boliviensis boliviensis TaxID=39432 RepID=A0A2K6TIG0_SAIBB